jgi:replicative DNA helicase
MTLQPVPPATPEAVHQPDQDYVDVPAAARLAEQATLGALLLAPDAVVAVSGWLRAEDFADPWHRTLYATIRELDAAHRRPAPDVVAQAMIDRHGYRAADAPRILDLLAAVPTRPRPAEYAAVVLEASLRRQVACHGVLLQAAALAAALDRSPRVVDTVTAQIDAVAETAQTRWAIATRATTAPTTPAPASKLMPGGLLPSLVGADRLLSRYPLPDLEAVADREADLTAALITRPDHLDAVTGWLRPDALTSDTWRPVYAALVDLHDTGAPIDPVTVSWRIARTATTAGSGPSPRELAARVEHATILEPAHAATAVAADQLRLAAHRTAAALRTDAANLGLDLRDLLDTTLLHTRALRRAAAPLHPGSPGSDADDDNPATALAVARGRRASAGRHLAVVPR